MNKKILIEKLESIKMQYDTISKQRETMLNTLKNYNERLTQLSGAMIVLGELIEDFDIEDMKKQKSEKSKKDEIQNNK